MSLQFKKCKTCGRIFQSIHGLECPECIDDRERKFAIVRDYLYEYPGASMDEIVEETEVDPKLIIRFLKEGRLEMQNSKGLLSCEKCGAPISSGTMCTSCKDKLAKAMESVLPKSMTEKGKKESRAVSSSSQKDKLHVNVRGR